MKKKNNPVKRFLVVALSIILAVIIYAYGFTVTKVNLAETKSERRQIQLIRIIRALARPDIIEYEQTVVNVDLPILIPCTDTMQPASDIINTGPYMEIDSPCAGSQEIVHIRGYNFEPNMSGSLDFIPPSGVKLSLGQFTPDVNGKFEIDVKIPKGRESEDFQTIRAVTRTNVGNPKLTTTAKDTWDKIVETVFLALLATTLGTLLAVPLSFFAARNLMENLKSPIIGVSLGILIMPLGFVLGGIGAKYANELSNLLMNYPWIAFLLIVAGIFVVFRLLKWSLPQIELTNPSLTTRLLRIVALIFCAFISILVLFLIASTAINVGTWLELKLGFFAFLGKFVSDLGEILNLIIIVLAALGGLAAFNSIAGTIGRTIDKKGKKTITLPLRYLLSTLAGAMVAVLLGAGVNWLYQINNPIAVYLIPGLVGAMIGWIIAYTTRKTGIVPIGMVIYYVSRTIANALRSIEALIMAIIFVVWVGLGPFAGALALSLHTVAALIKLYSEQVESVMEGPIEAVKATGANQLQTIIYAVIPQITVPYISFTMYRWDINVRMSTIIGFAGGGGIGFLLQQNINLLNYRAASVQMIAIAIVVASMDYLSSKIRERAI
jgi:phosphonate ABC transporter permease subunit PhnE